MIKLDFKNSSINERMICKIEEMVLENHNKLHENPDDEKQFLGWVNLPENYDKKEFERIKKAAKDTPKDILKLWEQELVDLELELNNMVDDEEDNNED